MTVTSTAAARQYTEYAQQAQEALLNAVDTWTNTVREAAGQLPKPAQTAAEAERAIDDVVDFASKVLGVQRAYAHDVVKATTGALRRIPGFASA
jgi:acetyl-CoA carboxylase carboxyltransferase component